MPRRAKCSLWGGLQGLLLFLLLLTLFQLVHLDVGDGNMDPGSMFLLLCWKAARVFLRQANAVFKVASSENIPSQAVVQGLP